MSTVEHSASPRAASLLRVRRWIQPRPATALVACLVPLGVVAGLISSQVDIWALDETELERSAVSYTSHFPHSLLHDVNARATDRLYSLLLSVAFRLFSGSVAVRVDHVLNVVLFLSAAAPIYLLSRRVLSSPWAAVAFALPSSAFPWLTLTSALFTENLAYPLFWWAMLAACQALWRPRARNDLLVLVVIALLVVTRVQFVAFFAGYVVAIVVIAGLRFRLAPPPRRLRPRLRATLAAYPWSSLVVLAGVAVVIYLKASGSWASQVESNLGTYSNVVIRNGLPPNMAEGLLVELIALALGVGLLPAIVSLTWYVKRIVAPRLEQEYVLLAGSGTVLLVFLVLTVFSQLGYLGRLTEERYFFYVIPVFWLGTFAALGDRRVRAGELVVCSVGLAALYASIPFLSPLTSETAFLAPSQSIFQHVVSNRLHQFGVGLSEQDAFAIAAVFAGGVSAFLWSRGAPVRAAWTVGIAALVQLVVTGYAYAVITGHVTGIAGRTGPWAGRLGWVDAHSRTGQVAWLDDISATAPLSVTQQDPARTTLFWNKDLTSWLAAPQTGLPLPIFPMSGLPGVPNMQVDTSTGALGPDSAVSGIRELVAQTDSAFLQVRGSTLAQSPGHALSLIQPSRPLHALWLAEGLRPDGVFYPGHPVHVFAFGDSSQGKSRIRVRFLFGSLQVGSLTPGSAAQETIVLHLGPSSRTMTIPLGPTTSSAVSLSTCVRVGHSAVPGALMARRPAAGQAFVTLEHVVVTQLAGTHCMSRTG